MFLAGGLFPKLSYHLWRKGRQPYLTQWVVIGLDKYLPNGFIICHMV